MKGRRDGRSQGEGMRSRGRDEVKEILSGIIFLLPSFYGRFLWQVYEFIRYFLLCNFFFFAFFPNPFFLHFFNDPLLNLVRKSKK